MATPKEEFAELIANLPRLIARERIRRFAEKNGLTFLEAAQVVAKMREEERGHKRGVEDS